VVAGRPGRGGPEPTGAVVRGTLASVLEMDGPFRTVALAVPVGLLDTFVPGGRRCDRQARQLLGRRRGSAVAPAPVRAALGAATVDEARSSGPVSAATWHLMPWIREVDELLDASGQELVSSVHPELSFLRLGGRRALAQPKHTADGARERLCRVEQAVPGEIDLDASVIGPADRWRLVDALACLCTAAAIAGGHEEHLPVVPELDSTGLRMEFVW
jgi:predicted RNase H-like nuclease